MCSESRAICSNKQRWPRTCWTTFRAWGDSLIFAMLLNLVIIKLLILVMIKWSNFVNR